MKEFVGRKCKIHVLLNGKDLFYTVKNVTSVNDTHICFIDRYGEAYSFRNVDVVEISDI